MFFSFLYVLKYIEVANMAKNVVMIDKEEEARIK